MRVKNPAKIYIFIIYPTDFSLNEPGPAKKLCARTGIAAFQSKFSICLSPGNLLKNVYFYSVIVTQGLKMYDINLL